MRAYIEREIFKGNKYNLLGLIKVLAFNLNLRYIFLIRLWFWLRKKRIPFFAGFIYRKMVTRYGCFIGPNAQIGVGVQFPHPNGIVIGADTTIGENCVIYQQVTFGGKVIGDAQKGNYPKVGNNVIIFAGAKLIGDISVGDNVIIGANSVVNKDIPSFSVVAGVPARIIKTLPH